MWSGNGVEASLSLLHLSLTSQHHIFSGSFVAVRLRHGQLHALFLSGALTPGKDVWNALVASTTSQKIQLSLNRFAFFALVIDPHDLVDRSVDCTPALSFISCSFVGWADVLDLRQKVVGVQDYVQGRELRNLQPTLVLR